MKKLLKSRIALLVCFSLAGLLARAQDAEKPELLVNLRYFNVNNSMQYLQVETKAKVDNKLQVITGVDFDLYLDSSSADNLIGKVKTNDKGIAKAVLPVSLKDKWNAEPAHKFIAVSKPTKTYEAITTELGIAKSRISIDTLNDDGTRSVAVKVEKLENGSWIPAKDVELKIGVERLGGQLRIGEDESYTTDSTGSVTGEFKLDSLPANDGKGDITLVAKADDNESYGNLSVEKTVPWGAYYTRQSHFGERSLWATRTRVPLWLLFMASTIIAIVWSVVIYLIFQIVKIKKLGKQTEVPEEEKAGVSTDVMMS